jgi:fructokinase
MRLFGGIEAGGTKFVCTIGSGPGDIRATIKYPTTNPQETIQVAIDFFKAEQKNHGPLAAIGVAAFGPLDPRLSSRTYGYITSTPKPGWANVDLVGALQQALPVPIGFDTDVNGAALGEWRWGAAQDLDTFIYLTADPFPGGCPFHGDCLEGMANGPAIEKRWGQKAEALPIDHPAWELEAGYLAFGLASLICTLSPQRIILGGGVMQQAHLFPMVRHKTQTLLNGYVQAPEILENIDAYIVPPGLGSQSGMLGAIVLAEQAIDARN